MNNRGKKVKLLKTGRPSLKRYRGKKEIAPVPVGTEGVILAQRQMEDEPEMCYLVKFKGAGWPCHLEESWIEFI